MEISRKIENRRVISVKLLATLASLIVFCSLAFVIHSSGGLSLDNRIVEWAEQSITGSLYSFISLFTNLGHKLVVITIGIISLIILWWKTRDYIGMVTLAVVLIGSNELFQILKGIFLRERPILDPAIDALGYSFPSGHATVSMAFYGMILYLISKHMTSSTVKTGVLISLGLYIFLIGVSRILLRAHYLTDVIAGFAIGFIYLMICIFLYEKMTERIGVTKKKKSELTF
ncbi:phosphatase PAP2 family protein [Bacillus pinisoli]|uniref:phosphatase PAP2 family protein n=1 Tax=Bacillus pinisoli TaxID=2901866 RepID=UPI001FF4FA00|nr:phosphatase PAP2 family protein [Bacillus pinisoli]